MFKCQSSSTVIVDSDGETCATASFTFGGTATNRAYDIKVPENKFRS